MSKTIAIGKRRIGDGQPALLVAEMSANHDRDLKQALALLDIAAQAGVDAVKLQTYGPDSLTLKTNHPSARIDPIWGAASLYELYAQAAMPYEFHEPLFKRAEELGLLIFSTVYDERDVDFLEKLGNPIYKIASFELVHLPLLRRVGQTHKPVVLSTGMATLDEVQEALTALTTGGSKEIILLHCCSAYPTPPEAANLAAMKTLRDAFHRPIGFSDHTLGVSVAAAAAALGACFIEKHFTNDPQRKGPDHRFSASPEELRELVRAVRQVESAIGKGDKATAACELESKRVGRRSIFAVVEIPQGAVIVRDMVRVVRPAAGLHPRHLDEIIGRKARRKIPAGWPVTGEDV
jgi:N-acetylneuraminate synthase